MTEGRYAENFGTTFLRADIHEFLKDPQMKGLILWNWADYRHRRTFIASGPKAMGMSATYGPWGLVTMDRKPKQLLMDVLEDEMAKWKLPQE